MSSLMQITWLASYPRSGNTFLRSILFNCFGLKSGSIYPNDLGGNKSLESFVGHIEHGENKTISFPNTIPLIKTHDLNKDDSQSIYVIRDGRATCVSFWNYYGKKISMKDIILGNHMFGKWCDHVTSWHPKKRNKTLLLKYEEMVDNFEITLDSISAFLEQDIISKKLPSRETIAKSDGKWVRSKTDWRAEISSEELDLFNEVNYPVLKEYGYAG